MHPVGPNCPKCGGYMLCICLSPVSWEIPMAQKDESRLIGVIESRRERLDKTRRWLLGRD
jgi:hypothetical protein